MKKSLLILLLMLVPSFAALAQYVPSQIEQSKGRLLDDKGEVMPDFMVQRLVGETIFNETYVGAVKQYKTGKRLITGGIIGTGAGLAVSGISLGIFIADYIKIWGGTNDLWDAFMGAKDSLSWFYRGFSIAGVGASVLTAGIVFKTIGWKRLEWVADEYNSRHPATLEFGLGEYGPGLVYRF